MPQDSPGTLLFVSLSTRHNIILDTNHIAKPWSSIDSSLKRDEKKNCSNFALPRLHKSFFSYDEVLGWNKDEEKLQSPSLLSKRGLNSVFQTEYNEILSWRKD